MKHYAVIGSPIAHSRSPEIYHAFFDKYGVDADFLRIEVDLETLPEIRSIAADLSGFAVTMPLKRAIIPYLDYLTDTAKDCGAVNIVERAGDKLIGHNTDGGGLCDALTETGVNLAGSTVLILGRGGAASSAAAALKKNGCEVGLIVRTRKTGQTSCAAEYLLSEKLPHADIFINAAPLGMAGREDFTDFSLLDRTGPATVFDMVYLRDGKTSLIREAEARGLTAIDGSRMLYWQAVRAFEIFTSIKIDRG